MDSFSGESEGESFEVAKILDVRKKGRTLEYLVKWKDFESDEETWEPVKNLKGAEIAIKNFEDGRLESTPSRRKTSQEVQKKESVTQRSGRSISRKTTVTKTETRTRTGGTQSESSSPESSPLVQRRQIIKKTEVQEITSDTKNKQQKSAVPGQGILELSQLDLPVVVLMTCVLFIALTFVVQQN